MARKEPLNFPDREHRFSRQQIKMCLFLSIAISERSPIVEGSALVPH